ncbi:NAD(P)H-dependent oxidoreductase [Tumebacillus permanentifrigoris]|uniref:Putative NADPH-quinone reductase n=1 Tax=Tumebacillus permanentifrigoris TaxID=378543 RepID=A0A316D440_9BACL|nr:NAD(P)H-dependent oxidoreductase [Tumebacillus permanentifrigoris]PWK06997.1 putative NADPH-quinone reductase [Tumebacillus permanentifrigoris]
MKVLVLVAHPNFEGSRVNQRWAQELEAHENVTVHNLYQVYPDGAIDVAREQQLLLDHDRIVLQFPLYWYSTPSLLKKWQDDVLQYGFAYGSEGNKLNGKDFVVAISTGGPAEAYQAGGYNQYTLSELLRPLQATANLIGARYLPIFSFSGLMAVTDEQIEDSAKRYAAHILGEY